MNPIDKFRFWYNEQLEITSVKIPSACCLSSIGEDGYPNSRFVSLKEIVDGKFVITGPLHSRKGKELLANSRASLVFWWTETERQVRIQGDAILIEKSLADTYFSERNKESQIVSQISKQGAEINDHNDLTSLLQQKKDYYSDKEVIRPKDWLGFYIVPKRIEFMTFRTNRLHLRELYVYEQNQWHQSFLEP